MSQVWPWLPALARVGQLDLLVVWLAPDCAGMRRVTVPAVDTALAGPRLKPQEVDRHQPSSQPVASSLLDIGAIDVEREAGD